MSSAASVLGRKRVIDSDSDSDDNVPLSQLRADAAAVKKEETKTEVKTETKTETKTEVKTENKTETNGSAAVKAKASDSDDDVPIVGLAKRKKLKVETKTVKAEPARRSAVTPTPRSSGSTPRKTKKRIKIKYKQQECTEELYQSLKGRLTQELLCRWWYAVQWPPAKANAPKLHGVQELDGYPGAYIRVRGDEMGSTIDTRSPVGKPSFLHFFSMPAEQIKELLLKAYDEQMKALIESEGEGVPLLKELKKASASAARIDPGKADRGVNKVLKKYAELAKQIKEEQERMEKEAETAEEDEEDEVGDADDDDDDTAGQGGEESSTADDDTADDE